MTWEKNADTLIERMGNIKLLSLIEHAEFIRLSTDIIKLSKLDYLNKFLNKCKIIKNIDPLIFLENYGNLLKCSLNETIEQEKKDYCEALLASELIDIHSFHMSGEAGGYMLTASRGAKLDGLACLIEKGVSFTHIDLKGGNVFHRLGRVDYTIGKRASLKCLDYLMNQNVKVKQHLENTNYEMLCQTNDNGFGPVIIYLKDERHQLALFMIDQLSNFEVLEKIQSQITAYCAQNELSDDSLRVVSCLNEKIQIKNEKDTLGTWIAAHSMTRSLQNHKI